MSGALGAGPDLDPLACVDSFTKTPWMGREASVRDRVYPPSCIVARRAAPSIGPQPRLLGRRRTLGAPGKREVRRHSTHS